MHLLPPGCAPHQTCPVTESPAPATRLKVLIVDDDDFVRVLLTRTIVGLVIEGSGPIAVADCANAADAMALAGSSHPDVAILDLDLGGGPNGIDLAYGLRRVNPAIGIIILSSYQDPRLLGANRELPDGSIYLSKRSVGDADTLRDAVAKVVNRPRGPKPKAQTVSVGGRKLSDNQVDIMRLIAEGYSNAEIARRRSLTLPAVEKAITRLIKQLDLNPGKEDNSRVLITQAYYELIGATQVRRD